MIPVFAVFMPVFLAMRNYLKKKGFPCFPCFPLMRACARAFLCVRDALKKIHACAKHLTGNTGNTGNK